MLVEDVPIDFTHTQAKPWFGMTGRQFLLVLPAGLIAAGAIGLTVWSGFDPSPVLAEAKEVVNDLLPLPAGLVVLFGWWRPHGLLPEIWLKAWRRQKQVLDKGPLTVVGQMVPHRGAGLLPGTVMMMDDPETPVGLRPRGRRGAHR